MDLWLRARTCILKFWGTVHHLGARVASVWPRAAITAGSGYPRPFGYPEGLTSMDKDAQVEEPKVLNKLELLSTPGERARATGTSSPFWGEASTSPFDRLFTHSWPRRLRGAPPSPTAGTRIVDHANYLRRCPATVIGHR